MSKSQKTAKKPVERTPLQRVLRVLYIVLVVVSLVVVATYIGLKIFAPAPDVPDQMVFYFDDEGNPSTPDQSGGGSGGGSGNGSSGNSGSKLVLNRREGVYTCLLLGVADLGGSDTIMLGVFDTNEKTASLISVPRDTVVKYNGSNIKINASYSYGGGAEAVAKCVSEMLAVPIDYYVTVNTKAFREIVDEIGGVYFDVPVNMKYSDPKGGLYIDVKKGYQLLDGKQAEGVVRCRSCYSNADIGRAATQRAFLIALAKQTITLSNVGKVTSLINILNTYVGGNMPLNDMVFFGTQAVGMDLDTALNTGALDGKWRSPYWVLNDDSVVELVNSLGIYEEEVPAKVLKIVHP